MRRSVFSLLKLLHFWFPVALGWSIAQVVHRATGAPIYSNGVVLFLSGIWAAYSLDRIVDSKTPQPLFLRVALAVGLVFSIVLCAFSAAHLSIKTLSAVLVFSFLALLYRRLKKYPLLKTFVVALVWVWAGASLSIEGDQWFGWNWVSVGATLPLFLLIAAGCILCDLKDVEADERGGVKSVPVLFGVRRTIFFVSVLAGVAVVLALTQDRLGLAASGAVLIAFAQYPAILATEDVGPLLVDFILTLPGILIAAKLV